jgi:RHS repeat-associated protein
MIQDSGNGPLSGYDAISYAYDLHKASEGTPVASYDYDAHRNVRCESGMATTPSPFSANSTTIATGLVFYGFRYYCPGTGRWLSRDPLENAERSQGPNLYTYVANNPVNGVDPLGLWNLWNPLTYGVPSNPGENPWNPIDSSAEWGATGQGAKVGAAAYADGFNPFGDPCDPINQLSKSYGKLGRDAVITYVGGRALAWAGGTAWGRILDHNRYLRLGPGKFPNTPGKVPGALKGSGCGY